MRPYDENGIRIRNKDIPRLTRVVSVMQTVRANEEKRQWIRERMYGIPYQLCWTANGSHSGSTPKGLLESYAQLSDLEEKYQEIIRRGIKALKEAENILNGIPYESMRAFVELAYVEQLGAKEIRGYLNLTERGYRTARESIENAPSMADVKWHERYVLERRNDER